MWKDILKFLFGSLLGIIFVLLLAVGIAKCKADENDRKYNNGICTECGCHYIYEQALAHAYDTDYLYICDKCGRMIELESYRAERREDE